MNLIKNLSKKMTKEPKYKNSDLLQYCTKLGFKLPWDERFLKLTETDVVGLCYDLEKLYAYFVNFVDKTPLTAVSVHHSNGFKIQIDEREKFKDQMCIAAGLVWAAIYFIYDSYVPEEFRPENLEL